MPTYGNSALEESFDLIETRPDLHLGLSHITLVKQKVDEFLPKAL